MATSTLHVPMYVNAARRATREAARDAREPRRGRPPALPRAAPTAVRRVTPKNMEAYTQTGPLLPLNRSHFRRHTTMYRGVLVCSCTGSQGTIPEEIQGILRWWCVGLAGWSLLRLLWCSESSPPRGLAAARRARLPRVLPPDAAWQRSAIVAAIAVCLEVDGLARLVAASKSKGRGASWRGGVPC